jgi:uncharacterized protein (TIGR04255 family)
VALDFGEHADVVFERAPLATVLTQVKFPPVLSLLAPAGVAGFQAATRSEYPTLLPLQHAASISITPESFGIDPLPPVWRFASEDSQWIVGLATESVSLETTAYVGIDDFLDRFRQVLAALRRTIRPAASTRVGLRKVNYIPAPDPHDTHSLVGMIRPEVLGMLAVPSFPAPISAHETNLVFQDDFAAFNVRTSLQTTDAGVTNFILDLDYYTSQPYTTDAADGLLGLLRHFSDGATNFFHWALEDEFKASLGPRPRSDATEAS